MDFLKNLFSGTGIKILFIVIVLDLIFVVIGSQLWKKANHIKPASEKNKFTFWLWNNLGFIVSVIAFMPIIILILVNKDADKKPAKAPRARIKRSDAVAINANVAEKYLPDAEKEEA